jgi:hypothetical protein
MVDELLGIVRRLHTDGVTVLLVEQHGTLLESPAVRLPRGQTLTS